ncbi:unnamed protein product [Miscanthus lutarioriparius]|uniref:hAT-like transposase RNase-H fold domain-containing protein n=1 Tax=Miscanthus lutarioriparius TaxID=422564 RepID=A0A811MYN6_9POAL|nr:unnamed protein product [Miscanthus lutarioriparius]
MGHHIGTKLSRDIFELMVKWYIDKRMFALTLDNASANEVAVKDIISDLRANASSTTLICDGLFFHVRCACHILNLVARDGLSVITPTIENIRQLVLAVKGSPLQWEELMKRATECGLDTNKGLSLDVSTRWNDITISAMATSMSRKFEKYWKKSSTTLAVACFLDPRYKKRLIEFYMRKFHGVSSQVHVDELVDVMKKLYQFYAAAAPSSSRPKSGSNDAKDTDDMLVDSGDDELENFLYESSGHGLDDMNEKFGQVHGRSASRLKVVNLISWHGGRTGPMSILFFQK